MKMKLPMRFRILQLICSNVGESEFLNTNEISEQIFKEYGDEKQCNEKVINTHILALKSVGLIKEIEVSLNNDKLISKFQATDTGIKRLNLIPQYAK